MFKVLTYAQQSKELANIEQDKLAKRIQEFRTQAQLDNLQASNSLDTSVVSDGIHGSGINSYRSVETAPQSIVNGKVKTIFFLFSFFTIPSIQVLIILTIFHLGTN